MFLGLKCSTYNFQFYDRIKYQPDLIEFHLDEKDFSKIGISNLIEKIVIAKDLGIDVVLHQPMKFLNKSLNIADDGVYDFFCQSATTLNSICEEFDCKFLLHAHYDGPDYIPSEIDNIYLSRINKLNNLFHNRLYWENSTSGFFSFQNERFSENAFDLGLNLCFDISHSFIANKGCNQKTFNNLEDVKDLISYFHICDSMGMEHDSLSINEGLIDWKLFLPYIVKNNKHIFEIGLSNFNDCKEMIESYNFLSNLNRDGAICE